VPKKVRKLALKMALSSKLEDKNIIVLDQFSLDRIKTKDFISVIDALDVKKALVVTEKADENLEKSSRNIPDVKVLRSDGLNVYDILKYKNLVLIEAVIKQIEERLLS